MNTEDSAPLLTENSPARVVFRNGSWKDFKDPDPRTKLVYFFLILWILSLVTIPLSRLQIMAGQSPELFTLADIISYPSFLAFILSYFIWLARVTENARLIAHVHKATLSPIRHFLYYILPVWNLYGPYDGMKTVYEESTKAAEGGKKVSLLPIRIWWLLVLNAVASPFYFSNEGNLYHTLFQFPDTPPVSLLSLSLVALFTIMAGVATFFVIHKVTLSQKDIMAELESES